MQCVFCYREERRADKEAGAVVCSNCIQKLLQASDEQINKAYHEALELGFTEKAEALESLTDDIEGGQHEQRRPKNHERHFDRKGIARLIGNEKIRAGQATQYA